MLIGKRLSVLAVFFLALVLTATTCAQFGTQVQYFPQLAAGAGSETSFSIHNPGTHSATVRLELRSSSATVFHDSSVTIPPGGTQTVSLGNGQTSLQVGWAQLTATSGEFTATEFFQLEVGGQHLPRIGVLPSSPAGKLKLFGFVGGETNTGVAVANPSETKTATLNVRLLTTTGVPLLSSSTTLPPRSHLARYLTEAPWFPGLQNFEGMVEVESTEPIVMTMLRSDNAQLTAAPVITPAASGVSVGGITRDYLADGAVSTEKLADGAVTSAKLANGSVSLAQLHPDVSGSLAFLSSAVNTLWETTSDGKTRLLFPFVTNQAGFDTGITIINTGQDPSGTIGRSGSVKLYYYGTSSAGQTPAPQTSAAIAPGKHAIFALSAGGVPAATSSAQGFQGYIVAVCDFPLAHGYYVISDFGMQTHAWGGEAIVLPPTRDPSRVESRGH